MSERRRIYLPDVVGGGYAKFWNFRGYYTCVKGSRMSKKSKTTALWMIYHIMKYPLSHGLVIRRYWNTHRDSTFADLKWAARRLGVIDLFKFPKSEVKITYLPTGQTILFRGMDDPDSITSISVDFGGICWVWFEEAFQIVSEDDFDKVVDSVRGGFVDKDGNDIGFPKGYYRRVILTLNPWSYRWFGNKRFFHLAKETPEAGAFYEDSDTLAMTTDYRCNEWLTPQDRRNMEAMKARNPKMYMIAGLGHWGVPEGLIFSNWEERDFDWQSMERQTDIYGRPKYKKRYGMDFGFSNDPTAAIGCLVDDSKREVYVYYEHYRTGETNMQICEALEADGMQNKPWVCDCAEPKSIQELWQGLYDEDGRLHRLPNCRKSRKGRDSIIAGITKLQDYRIIVLPRCENTIIELSNYAWEKDPQTGKPMNRPCDEFNHAMDALRYACEDIGVGMFSFK